MKMKARPAKSRTRKPTTKKAQLIRLLSAKSGADIEAISNKLGWQSHTIRAAITGLKKAGYAVSREKEGGKPTRYRIAAAHREAEGAGPLPASKADEAQVTANAG